MASLAAEEEEDELRARLRRREGESRSWEEETEAEESTEAGLCGCLLLGARRPRPRRLGRRFVPRGRLPPAFFLCLV